MVSRKFGASHEASGTSENIQSEDRLSKLRQLYFNSYSIMRESTYERFPELLPWDFDAAMGAVAGLLPTYAGPPDSEPFERWTKRKIAEESFRYICLHLGMNEYRRMIVATIAKEMWTSAEDCSIGADDLYSEVLTLIFDRAPLFLKNKRAKLSTRMCALAKKHTYLYYNSRNKKRLAAITRRIVEEDKGLGVETLSAVEMASIKSDAVVDGYAEAGLHLA